MNNNNIIKFDSECLIDLIVVEVGNNFNSNVESYFNNKMYRDNVSIINFMEMVFEELEDIGVVLDNSMKFNNNFCINFENLFIDVYKNNSNYSKYRIGKMILDFILNYKKYMECSCCFECNKNKYSNNIIFSDRLYLKIE